MKRLLVSLLLLSFCLTGCDKVSFRGFFNGGTASGTVSTVQLTVVDGDVTVTVVTLVNIGVGATTIDFCGDQRGRFPMDQFVRVEFTPQDKCSILSVVIV